VTPAAVPDAPSAPTVQAVPNDPTGQKLDVQWPAVTGSAANGDPVSSYALMVTSGGSTVQTDQVVPTSSTENPIAYLVSGLSDKVAYTFTVTATNKAGPSLSSPPSAPFTVFGQPAAITDLSATSNENQQSTLTFTNPDPNGQAISSYLVSVDGGSYSTLAANHVVTGLSNGVSHTFVVEACNTYCSSPSNQATGKPDAPPSMPGVSGSAVGTTFSFNWGAPTSNGCPITQEGWSTTGGAPWNNVGVGAGGTGNIAGGYNQTITVTLFAQDACGLSATSSGSATSGPPPNPPTVHVGRGGANTLNGGYWVNVSGSGFPANAQISFSCSDPQSGTFWANPGSGGFGAWYSTDGAGNLGWSIGAGTSAKSCYESPGYNLTVTVTAGGVTASGNDPSF